MTFDDRKSLIQKIESVRGSRIVSLILSDRPSHPEGIPGFAIQIGPEIQNYLLEVLVDIGKVEKIDLMLFTRGGDTNAVWPIVMALRSRCEHLSVIVPHRAHSAGTMICLGANEVVMGDCAELSPIDATTGNAFNPRDPGNPQQIFGISVEDVAAYFELSKRLGRIEAEPYRMEVFRELTRKVQPLALGNVERVHQLIRRLAFQLLSLHIDKKDERIPAIVDGLTREFYSHSHAVMRDEAIELIGDWIIPPSDELVNPMNELFRVYKEALLLNTKFYLPEEMGEVDSNKDFTFIGGFLESSANSYRLETKVKVLQRPGLPPGVQLQVPPGQSLPLLPWVKREYEFGLRTFGWITNSKEETL